VSSGKQVQLRSSAARRSKPPRKTQRNGTSRRGKPWRLLRAQLGNSGWPRSFSAFGRRFDSGCVLRTASVSISRSTAFVFGGSRGVLCQMVMEDMWGWGGENQTKLGPLAEAVALRSRANFANLWFGGVALLKESRDFNLGKMLPAFRIA
jgi:hypothetical protein